jgi:D-glycero-alpha-D-manno-heptose-7-phosphate kinase
MTGRCGMAKGGRLPRLVTTMTPLRLSFIGGGSDIPDFYCKDTGAVLSTTIDKYIYVTAKRHSPLFNEAYRVNYSVTEHTSALDDIENDIVRECLRLVPMEPPLYIGTTADLPANSGLASSSVFAVGLLYALHMMRGEDASAGQLAEEACAVEIDRLKRPIGKQDQYAAAFGGLNLIQFHGDGKVTLDPIWLRDNIMEALFDSSLVFWTGIQRDSATVLTQQRERINDTRAIITAMRDDALRLRDLFRNGFDLKKFGALLDCNWRRKRELASLISDEQIDQWYERALSAGALGGKLLGAGGGGFLYLVAPLGKHPAIRAALSGLHEVPIAHEPRGSRVAYTVA